MKHLVQSNISTSAVNPNISACWSDFFFFSTLTINVVIIQEEAALRTRRTKDTSALDKGKRHRRRQRTSVPPLPLSSSPGIHLTKTVSCLSTPLSPSPVNG